MHSTRPTIRRRRKPRDLDTVTTATLAALDDQLASRPSAALPWRLSVRLDANAAAALHQLASREGVSLGAVSRRLLRESLRREGAL